MLIYCWFGRTWGIAHFTLTHTQNPGGHPSCSSPFRKRASCKHIKHGCVKEVGSLTPSQVTALARLHLHMPCTLCKHFTACFFVPQASHNVSAHRSTPAYSIVLFERTLPMVLAIPPPPSHPPIFSSPGILLFSNPYPSPGEQRGMGDL